MRILQITPRYAPDIGGVETHVQQICEEFVAQGNSVTVVTMSRDVRRQPTTIENGVRVIRLRSIGVGADYRFPVGLRRFLQRHRADFDIVHAHNFHASPLLVTALTRPPNFVITPHLNDRPHSRPAGLLHRPYRMVGVWAFRRAHTLICVSEAERHRLHVGFGIAPERIRVVPNGVRSDLWTGTGVAHERDGSLILSVGRLEAYKRVQSLVACVAALPAPFRVVVVGDGPQRVALEHQAARLKVESRIQFLGRISNGELIDLYRRAAVVVNLSSAEAFGLTVLEALAGGARVLCSDIPAFQEMQDRFPHVVTLQSDLDPGVLARSIAALAASPVLPSPDLGPYTWQGVSAQLVRLYAGVLDSSGPARK